MAREQVTLRISTTTEIKENAMSKKALFMSLVGCISLILITIPALGQASTGSSVTFEGQVVCSSCWFEADRKVTPYGSEENLKCAVTCAKSGKFQALAVMSETEATLYLLEPGKMRRDRQDWLDYIGKYVKATGTVREDGKKLYLRVDSIELVSSSAKPDDVKTEAPAQDKGGQVQSVKVNITDNGFEPSSFQLKQGIRARVTFLRQSEVTCATEVVIPAFHIKRSLPLNEPVVVEFTPDKTGEFGFACGMGMLHGKFVVR
jgi:hypothetical protein